MVEQVEPNSSGNKGVSKMVLSREALTLEWTPATILHRDQEKRFLREILAPAMDLANPANAVIYGHPGAGKTVTIRSEARAMADQTRSSRKPLVVVELNCNIVRSIHAVISGILSTLGEEMGQPGLDLSILARKAEKFLDASGRNFIVVLDEADRMGKSLDEAIYLLSRMNNDMNEARVSVWAVSNTLTFMDLLDERSKSSMSPREYYFQPYSQAQLRTILDQRVGVALGPDAISSEALDLCASIASSRHGDARKAIALLRAAVEVAEAQGLSVVTPLAMTEAVQRLELNKMRVAVATLPHHQALVMRALAQHSRRTGVSTWDSTGTVHRLYEDFCKVRQVEPVTMRSTSTYLNELCDLGILLGGVKDKGRMGRTQEVQLGLPVKELEEYLGEEST